MSTYPAPGATDTDVETDGAPSELDTAMLYALLGVELDTAGWELFAACHDAYDEIERGPAAVDEALVSDLRVHIDRVQWFVEGHLAPLAGVEPRGHHTPNVPLAYALDSPDD